MAVLPLTKTLVAAIATGAYDGPTESRLAVWTRQMNLARKQGLRNAAQVADYAATRCAEVVEKCPPTLRNSADAPDGKLPDWYTGTDWDAIADAIGDDD